ncbi:hypothetical protein EBQ34_01165 [Vandammella animalimorsus]|uniref:Transcriptional regulator n=2 Tax=Vandammella animalimorsus TaxID=2029117 RepID=A0A3M6RVJ6_9BURK|nr:hypothetical protein EBQ34_01165 [Vandammella animalimorsus]
MNFFDEASLRLKQQLKVTEDKQAAETLGMTGNAWTMRKRRGSFPEKELRALAQQRPELGIDVEYVLTGLHAPVQRPDAYEQPVHERLKIDLLRLGLSAGQAAQAVGVPESEMRNALLGVSAVPAAWLAALAPLKLDVVYVLLGKGQQQVSYALNPTEERLLRGWRACSADVQAVVMAAIAAGETQARQ